MIPTILYYIWFGNNTLTPLVEECIDSWNSAMPDWRNSTITREIINALVQLKRKIKGVMCTV